MRRLRWSGLILLTGSAWLFRGEPLLAQEPAEPSMGREAAVAASSASMGKSLPPAGAEEAERQMRDLRKSAETLLKNSDRAGARLQIQNAVTLGSKALETEPDHLPLLRELTLAHSILAQILLASGDLEAAAEFLPSLGMITTRAFSAAPRDTLINIETSRIFLTSGKILVQLEDLEGASQTLQAGLGIIEGWADANPGDVGIQALLLSLLAEIAALHRNSGDRVGEVAAWTQGVPIAEALAVHKPEDFHVLLSIAEGSWALGQGLEEAGDRPGAIARYRRSVETADRLIVLAPQNGPLLSTVSRWRRILGDRYGKDRDSKTALVHYRRAVELSETLIALEKPNSENQLELAQNLESLAIRLKIAEEAAAVQFDRLLVLRRALAAEDPGNRTRRFELLRALYWKYEDSGTLELRGEFLRLAEDLQKEGALPDFAAKLVDRMHAKPVGAPPPEP